MDEEKVAQLRAERKRSVREHLSRTADKSAGGGGGGNGSGVVPRRRETTAGSVLFDAHLRSDVAMDMGTQLLAGPEYRPGDLPSPHRMDDNPYQRALSVGGAGLPQPPRHRRKVSRTEVDPAVTLSSPPVLNEWNDRRNRPRNAAVDPAW
jgi:hypothetical protein